MVGQCPTAIFSIVYYTFNMWLCECCYKTDTEDATILVVTLTYQEMQVTAPVYQKAQILLTVLIVMTHCLLQILVRFLTNMHNATDTLVALFHHYDRPWICSFPWS